MLVEHGLGEQGEKHFRLVHDTFATILKISTATKTSSTDAEPPFKFPHDHELFVRLEKLLVDGILRLQDNQVWILDIITRMMQKLENLLENEQVLA